MAGVTFILASGPSQHPDDVKLIRDQRQSIDTVIAVNRMIFRAPWADICYACDKDWWKLHGREIRHLDCRKVSVMGASKNYGASEIFRSGRVTGLGETKLHSGGSSTYQAINLAYIEGAKTIVLTGTDCAWTFGKRHCHEDYPPSMGNADNVKIWLERFPTLAKPLADRGVRVINCSRFTELDCFERMPLQTFMESRNAE